MNGLVKIQMVKENENWAFPDVETFVEFAIDYIRTTQRALVRLPQNDLFNFSKFLKLKYHALTLNDAGEIMAEKMLNGKKPNKIMAEGKKEVIQMLKKEGF